MTNLQTLLYILITYDDRTHIITGEQAQAIVAAKNSGKVQTVSVGDDVIILSNIRDIPTLETYQRQMKHKLQEKGKRMCRRCFMIVARMEECPCRDRPDRYPSIIETHAQENPQLKQLCIDLHKEGVKLIS